MRKQSDLFRSKTFFVDPHVLQSGPVDSGGRIPLTDLERNLGADSILQRIGLVCGRTDGPARPVEADWRKAGVAVSPWSGLN